MPILSPVHSLQQTSRLHLYAKSVDMRRSFDGLHAIVQSEFNRDILGGDIFLFLKKLRWGQAGFSVLRPIVRSKVVTVRW